MQGQPPGSSYAARSALEARMMGRGGGAKGSRPGGKGAPPAAAPAAPKKDDNPYEEDDFDRMDKQEKLDQEVAENLEEADKKAEAEAKKKAEEEKKKRKTSAYMTKYERARIIGTRAMQISLNSPIMVPLDVGEDDPMEIAEKELRQGKIPFHIRRKLPNGETEIWKVEELIDPN
ncbi:unnamed protein product [Amoebophrya sp. A120]|nr:unnamed protein product [Amoebophrya sp. A120]|eukprot:GSA120T00001069001.1